METRSAEAIRAATRPRRSLPTATAGRTLPNGPNRSLRFQTQCFSLRRLQPSHYGGPNGGGGRHLGAFNDRARCCDWHRRRSLIVAGDDVATGVQERHIASGSSKAIANENHPVQMSGSFGHVASKLPCKPALRSRAIEQQRPVPLNEVGCSASNAAAVQDCSGSSSTLLMHAYPLNSGCRWLI